MTGIPEVGSKAIKEVDGKKVEFVVVEVTEDENGFIQVIEHGREIE